MRPEQIVYDQAQAELAEIVQRTETARKFHVRFFTILGILMIIASVVGMLTGFIPFIPLILFGVHMIIYSRLAGNKRSP